MSELKQALLDIEFLQECNNSVNLALSVTRKELAAAKSELAELKEKCEAQNDAIVIMENSIADDMVKLEQAEAQCAAYKKALDIAMSTNQSHETYCKVEAALEEK